MRREANNHKEHEFAEYIDETISMCLIQTDRSFSLKLPNFFNDYMEFEASVARIQRLNVAVKEKTLFWKFFL